MDGTATSYLQDLVGGLPRVLVESSGGQHPLATLQGSHSVLSAVAVSFSVRQGPLRDMSMR